MAKSNLPKVGSEIAWSTGLGTYRTGIYLGVYKQDRDYLEVRMVNGLGLVLRTSLLSVEDLQHCREVWTW